MKGYIPIEIPTKRYICAFIHAQLGPKPFMTTDHVIGSKLFDVLQHSGNERKSDFASKHYNTTIRIYISTHTFRQRGCYLNETNLKNFNRFLQALIKEKTRFLLDVYVPLLGSFEKAVVRVRELIEIEEEDWDTDSIKKDYYRYRIKQKLPLLYKKEPQGSVPGMSF